MFSKADFDVVGFLPTDVLKNDDLSKSERSFQSSGSQTETKVSDAECQAKSSRHLKVQTEEIIQSTNVDYDVDKLASFLNRICPSVIDELNKVEKSKAFTLYQTTKEDQFENVVKLLHTIHSENIPELPQVRVSCITWSCTGNVVSFGYETVEHKDWCTHGSRVDFYNVKRSDFDGKTPIYSIPTSSCVTALTAHPYEPSIVAVGTAGGEVHVWDLQRGEFDADIGNSVFHNERVTKISWENINSQLFLVTSSLDSYMFFYKVTQSISSVILTERYQMTNDVSPLKPGISTFAFSIQPGVFAVGLENGEIIHCSTFGAPNIPLSTAKNPVLRSMCKKTFSLVRDIKFSPFVDNIFVAAFTDDTFECYSLKETSPLYQIYLDFDIMGLHWSLTQKNIVLLWGKPSNFYVYNSDNGNRVAELEPGTNSLDLIKSTSFCTKSSIVAVSGEDGKVVILDVPQFYKI